MKAIINGCIITENSIETKKVLLFNEKIVGIIDADDFDEAGLRDRYGSLEVIDGKGHYIGPGFIDIHVHGSGNSDTMDGTIESIKTISRTICQGGVTAFLPTTMTMSQEAIYKALDCIRVSKGIDFKGAKVLGAHMEGPFINRKYKGVQDEKYCIDPDYRFIKDYIDVIKMITLAPEMDLNFEFIKKVKEQTDIVLSMGHTGATYEEGIGAIDAGISHGTHTFNAMTPLYHRNPGAVGAIMNSSVSCEIIADHIHVHKAAINILINAKGRDKVVLITDCIRAGFLSEGRYELGGQEVIVDSNSARLDDGTLAGSILSLNEAVKNVFSQKNLSLNEVINLASLNPARVIHMDRSKGSIKADKDADLILIDRGFNVLLTIVEGKTVFIKEDIW